MQTLYTVNTLENELSSSEPQKILQQHFDQTRSLFIYLIYFITEITHYAETDAHQRAGKHLPNASDLNVNTKIAGNETILKILQDLALKEQFVKQKPELIIDKELVRKIYHRLEESSEYKTYTRQSTRDKQEEKRIIEFILNDLLLANELFVQLLTGYIQKPGTYDFKQMMTVDKQQFAKNLLQTVLEKDGHLQGLITPKLKNWDPERIALLDMIMMKMGVAEFLYFETIPPKVTINEYIDLAKEYSTTQSGQFVNGILDNIHKELIQQGKMQKVEYKKT